MKMQGRITRIKETQVKEVHIMKIQVSSYKRNPEEVWGKYKSVNIKLCSLKLYSCHGCSSIYNCNFCLLLSVKKINVWSAFSSVSGRKLALIKSQSRVLPNKGEIRPSNSMRQIGVLTE